MQYNPDNLSLLYFTQIELRQPLTRINVILISILSTYTSKQMQKDNVHHYS